MMLWIFACFLLCHAQNPFLNTKLYVNPSFQSDIDKTLQTATDPLEIQNLKIARNAPSAFWLDVKSKVQVDSTELNTMNGILLDAGRHSPPAMVTFIVYDLPNRDCNARASNGEICCTLDPVSKRCNYLAPGDCAQGLHEYKTQYIDNIVSILKKHSPRVPISLVIEPDSLPNLVTNINNPACGNQATQNAYKQGITYAISQIAKNAPRVAMYIDAGHGGWLGWDNNAAGFQQIINSLNVIPQVRGFATNVANYQALGKMCPAAKWCLPINNHQNDECCADPCKLTTQWNSATNELNYVQILNGLFPNKNYIVDTGRNGIPNARQDCANWCNPRNTGMGQFPTFQTNSSGLVDALLWLKTPGESDGCSQILPGGNACPRFDSMCASLDSIGSQSPEPRVPEAGKWFDYQIRMLARNANFGKIDYSIVSSPPQTPTPNPTAPPAKPTAVFKTMNCDQCSIFIR